MQGGYANGTVVVVLPVVVVVNTFHERRRKKQQCEQQGNKAHRHPMVAGKNAVHYPVKPFSEKEQV
jgi:hypothetical protein